MSHDSPAVAVIFISTRTDGHASAYQRDAATMETLAREQPGFLGLESVRDAVTARGITVSLWSDEACALAWKQVAEHLQVQQQGRDRYYREYEVLVTQVLRSYRFSNER